MNNLFGILPAFIRLQSGSNGWDRAMRSVIRTLEAALSCGYESIGEISPPSSSYEGKKYIIAPNASGLWAGRGNQVAIWDKSNRKWRFYLPKNGQLAAVGMQLYLYNGQRWLPVLITEESIRQWIQRAIDTNNTDIRLELNEYLPLSGGTLSGGIVLDREKAANITITASNPETASAYPLLDLMINSSSAMNPSAMHYMRMSSPNKPISLLKFPFLTNTASPVHGCTGLFSACEARGDNTVRAAYSWTGASSPKGLIFDWTNNGIGAVSAAPAESGTDITNAEWTPYIATKDWHLTTKAYTDSAIAAIGKPSDLLSSSNVWTSANKFNRTVEFGAYGLIENLYSGCRLSGLTTVAKASDTYTTRLRLITGNDKTKPSIYFYTHNLTTEGAQPEADTAMFSVDGSKNPAHTGFFNGITAYKNIKINNGLQVDLPNYAAQEEADLHTALYGVYENNANSALADYSYNDFYGGLYTRGYSLCNFANNHPVFPNSIGWLRGTTVKLDGTTSKYATSVKAAGLIIDKDGHVKYYRSSASAAGDIADDTWAPVTDQTEDAELITKGYIDNQLKRIQSTGNTVNNNATSVILASQSSSTIQDGAGVSAIIASGACEIAASTDGQATSFSSIVGSANSKTSGKSRHCAIIGSQGVEVKDKVNGGIFYGYVAGSSANTANIQFSVEGAGVCTAKEFVTSNSADYAEFFENETLGVIPLGTLVTLNGDKVKIASDGDEIIGVVSASLTQVKNSDKSKFSGTPALIGADTPHTWAKRYLTGEFGEALYEEIPDPAWVSEIPDQNWTPSENETESDRPMIANPVEQRTIIQQIENPEYDSERMNIPRSERPEEWSCVGLIGQVHVRIDETVRPNGYLFAVNGIGRLSDTRTNLRCMKITTPFDAEKGCGVALCLLK